MILGGDDAIDLPQAFAVGPGGLTSLLVPSVQQVELHLERRSLDAVQPAISSDDAVFGSSAVIAEQPDSLRNGGVVRRDRPTVSDRAEVLRRIETEGARGTEGSRPASAEARAMRL